MTSSREMFSVSVRVTGIGGKKAAGF